MYDMQSKTMYKLVNCKKGWSTQWFSTQRDLVEHILRVFHWTCDPNEVLSRVKFCNTPDIETTSYERWDGAVLVHERFLWIVDNWGQIYTPATLDNTYKNGHTFGYKFKDLGIYNVKMYFRNNRVFTFRRGPVQGIHKPSRYTLARNIRYKRVLLERRDDQCAEYGLKGNECKNFFDDIWEWPCRDNSRSWKQDKHRRKQWQRGRVGEPSFRKTIAVADDIWEDYIKCTVC